MNYGRIDQMGSLASDILGYDIDLSNIDYNRLLSEGADYLKEEVATQVVQDPGIIQSARAAGIKVTANKIADTISKNPITFGLGTLGVGVLIFYLMFMRK